jgi:hypothetical protein
MHDDSVGRVLTSFVCSRPHAAASTKGRLIRCTVLGSTPKRLAMPRAILGALWPLRFKRLVCRVLTFVVLRCFTTEFDMVLGHAMARPVAGYVTAHEQTTLNSVAAKYGR